MKKHPTILVSGQYACGQTALIQAICPDGTVPDEAIHSKGKDTDFSCVTYQAEVVDFVDAPGIELGELASSYWNNLRAKLSNVGQWECVWYCIDGSKAVIQRGDLEIIKLAGHNTIAVITKVDLLEQDDMEKMVERLATILDTENIITVSSKNEIGLSKLLDRSRDMIFGELEDHDDGDDKEKAQLIEAWNNYFDRKEEVWVQKINESADEYVYWAAGRAFAIGLIPLPLADVFPLVANEAYMITKIGSCYGYAVDETIIASFLGCLGGSLVGKVVASFIPFLKAPIAAAVTYGVGCAAMAYFESDMKISADELKRIFTTAKSEGENIDWKTAS